MPLKEQIPPLRADIEKGDHHLRSGPERFARLDTDGKRKCGDALRILAANLEIIKRTLI